MTVEIRPAKKSEAGDLAVLADMAGHGLPSSLWRAARLREGYASDVEVGRARVLTDGHALSFRNMTVAAVDGAVAGMLLDYPIDNPNSDEDIAAAGEVIGPLLRLENEAVGSWYINMIAVYREYRGKGLAGKLLESARAHAVEHGMRVLSLIVEDDNPAVSLYRRFGFSEAAREICVPYEGSAKTGGNVVLMKCPVQVAP